jgi:regulator of protease activity HflC (stomatin/prohibitin superfamily)
MNTRILKLALVTGMVALTAACTRIETGEVGIRVDMSKQIQSGELMPGSWNQTLVGEVITFPVKDIPVTLENKAPLTADNSALADFDITVVYNINPSSVAELYSTKSRAFHAVDKGDTFLMYNYITTLVNNASYKAVRQYKSLEIADNRQKIEGEIRETVTNTLKEEKLDGSVSVSLVQIRNVQPNAEILAAATQYVKSQNEIKIKENEVKLAKLESERMAALATNSTQSIAYIQAQAELNYSEAAKAGKINTIIVPREFKGMINVSK